MQETRQILADTIKQEILADLQQRDDPVYRKHFRGNAGRGHRPGYESYGYHEDRALVESIKREIIADLEARQEARGEEMERGRSRPYGSGHAGMFHSDGAHGRRVTPGDLDRIKTDVMAGLQRRASHQTSSHADRTLVESIKRDIVADLEAQEEAREEAAGRGRRTLYSHRHTLTPHGGDYGQSLGPAEIERIRRDVLNELQGRPPEN